MTSLKIYEGVIANDPKHLENIFEDFQDFLKFENHSMLQANLLPLDSVFRKKDTFHDDRLGKTKHLVRSHF